MSQTARFPKEEMEAERNGTSWARLCLSGEVPVSFIQSLYFEFKVPSFRSWQTCSLKGQRVNISVLWATQSLWQLLSSAIVTVLGTARLSVGSRAPEDVISALKTWDDFRFQKSMDQRKVRGLRRQDYGNIPGLRDCKFDFLPQRLRLMPAAPGGTLQ